ncbi:MAG: acetyl-CoA carboxylase biotin carboxyl carrier protein [Candidatus Melainabacteria bacterium]|nr:acetyl-CoA carboxylase biotin carboxyl carrier protein [Candidatus Melainabacteria bacterium]MBI3309695.1 acetyl-CoA carboxylase biotin carboxyl carrier protein [Candidatus Melainabacteria bacterium]
MNIPWKEIEELTKYLEEKGLTELSIETKDCKISIKKGAHGAYIPTVNSEPLAEAQDGKSNSASSGFFEVKAPTVGTYYQSPTPGAEAFVKVGSTVQEGAVLCIIEAMKIMNELTSDVSGTVKEVLIKDGETVEYGQVIMRIQANK